jgi:hypothetical integral membrane protein (TIGR02206 family)
MFPLQIVFLALTALVPLLVGLLHRHCGGEFFAPRFCRGLALTLLGVEIAQWVAKVFHDQAALVSTLPMYLCDWAVFVTAAALWWRGQRAFDLAYFWGLAGTIQGLLTPAIPENYGLLREIGFFVIHSGIVIGVLCLVFSLRLRPWPRSWPWLLFWSEVYLFATLGVNALTGENYGFLAHPPPTRSLLDTFPQIHWQYVATINAVAVAAFVVLYVPWWVRDLTRGPSAPTKAH